MADSRLTLKTSRLKALIQLVESLRGKKGCPWDRKQTPQTIAVYLIEETYELIEAIAGGHTAEIREELGDVLFQIVFLASQYREQGHFDFEDIAGAVTEKMIRRHPHVFGDEPIDRAEDIPEKWDAIKEKETKHRRKVSILDSVPAGMPALMRAYRVSERAARAGFDWADLAGVIEKAEEEWLEFRTEVAAQDQKGEDTRHIAMEFGDILFTLVNVARFARIHPETALVDSIQKFDRRFRKMEEIISGRGRELASVSHREINELWKMIKKEEA